MSRKKSYLFDFERKSREKLFHSIKKHCSWTNLTQIVNVDSIINLF